MTLSGFNSEKDQNKHRLNKFENIYHLVDSLATLLPRDLRVNPRLPSVLVLMLNFVLQAPLILKVEEFERILDLKPVDEQIDLYRLCHREAEQIFLLVTGIDPLLGKPR